MTPPPTIAVVGANGFIGTRLVETLHLDGGYRVRPVVRRASALASSARFSLEGRIADALDGFAMREALVGCDSAVHCVAGDAWTIMRSAEVVYRAAFAAGCRRLVYISSASVHGQGPAQGTDERSPLSDRQPLAYNNAKVRAEQSLDRLYRRTRLELVVLRPGIVFGPRSSWISGLADAILAGTACFAGENAGVCNAVYVDNLVNAIRLAIESRRAVGETYLVGDDTELTWREFYRPVAEAFGVRVEQFPILPVPTVQPGFDSSIGWIRASGLIRAAFKRAPDRLKRVLRVFHAGLRSVQRPTPGAVPSLEMALLHACRYRLPWRKARDQLGYSPIVGTEEAFRRTIGWLSFAGYPVTAAPSSATADRSQLGGN